MSYLYGDSTPSTLEINFIDFLRDAVDFCAQALAADERIAEGKTRTRAREEASTAEIGRLERIGALIPKAVEGAPIGEAESAAARCVAAIVRSADELVRAAKSDVGLALEAENKKRDEAEARERESCVKALETLLVKHDLPEMKSDLHVALVAGGRYACRMTARTGFGLEVAVELEVPPNHLFEKAVRVDRVMERLEVQVPEMGGWLHKEIRLRAQHLEKHHVVEVLLKAGGDRLKLRASPDGKGPGFDVLYAGDEAAPRLVRIDDEEKGVETFDVEEADKAKLLALRDRLAAATSELGEHRRAVTDAKLDGESLRSHAEPAVLVERLIAMLAPEVQEIAARSQSPGELVLRRLLSGDRREEIFLSKQELKVKLESLDEVHRGLFAPLWRSAIRPPTLKAPTLGPTVPSFVPPDPEAFITTARAEPSRVAPPPPPAPRADPTLQAAGVIELRDVEVTLEDGPSNRNG
jgi:hypothetical protein